MHCVPEKVFRQYHACELPIICLVKQQKVRKGFQNAVAVSCHRVKKSLTITCLDPFTFIALSIWIYVARLRKLLEFKSVYF